MVSQCRKVSIETRMIFEVIPMWKPELRKNKIYAVVLLGIGWLIMLLDQDATAFFSLAMLAVPLFFARERWTI